MMIMMTIAMMTLTLHNIRIDLEERSYPALLWATRAPYLRAAIVPTEANITVAVKMQ